MKKFYLSLVGLVLGLTTAYADNVLSLQDVTTEEGSTEVLLPISLINESSITGFQCDLSLPSGVTVATDEYGDYIIGVERTTTKRHTISSSLQSDGSLRILCTSMTNATFSGNSGVVLNVTLAVSESMAAGTYNVGLKNIVLSDPDANRHAASDVTSILTIAAEEITVTANNITMVYGNQVPKLTYKSDGGELKGVPALSCSATSTSPVGTYPITITKGSIENKNVTYENGTLTIVKAPLTISAGNYTKKQGEENPKFTATYSGFKNGETSAVLTKQPTFTTDVTASTAPGQYAVKVSGAEAKNYEISYVNGTITVTENIILDSKNILSLRDIEIEAGNTEVVLSISMDNENSITGFQCDLSLPTGVTVATDEYSDHIIGVERTTTKRHTISSSLQSDGSLRILCTSMTNATFSGNSGVVLNVTLAVPKNMIAGTYNIGLKNIVLSDPDANRYASVDATAVFSVIGAKMFDVNLRVGEKARCIINNEVLEPTCSYSRKDVVNGSQLKIYFVPFEGYTIVSMKRNEEFVVIHDNVYEETVTENVVFTDICAEMLVDTFYISDYEDLTSPIITSEGSMVTIGSNIPNVKIYYTTDGSIPTSASTQYTNPFEVEDGAVVCAIAIVESEVSQQMISVNMVNAPSIKVTSRRIFNELGVELEQASEGVNVVLTEFKDGSKKVFKMYRKH